MMILLNGHSLTAKTKFMPERMNLQLSERNSTATMTLGGNAPTIAVGDWLRCEDGPAAGVVWRAKSVETQLETNTRTVQLEHAINTLKDVIMFGETNPGTTSAEGTARFILSKQSDWVLGTFSFSESQPYTFNGDDLFSAMETVSSTLDDCIWEYSFSSYPFKLHIRKLGSGVTAEMRADRNIRTLRKTVDRSRMYTRFYPIGKNDLHISGNYVSKNESTYGVICKTETDASKETESELRTWANTRLKKHCQPTVTVTISGIDLSAATGESLDNFEIGKLCRIPLPEFNTTITDRVTKLSFPDVINSPTDVTVTLSNERTDTRDLATIIQQEVKETISRSGRSGAKNAKDDHAWMVDTTDHIGLVAEAVAGEGADKDWSRVASVMVDGAGIHQRVVYTENGLVSAQAAIEVTERQINQTVQAIGKDGKVTAASICLAINNGSSEASISADRIRLGDGKTKLSSTMTVVSGGGVYITQPLMAKNITLTAGSRIRFDGNSATITESAAADIIRNLRFERSGNTYTLQKVTIGDAEWTDVGNFSRAVSTWTWGGGSGKINVTALPQNQTKSVNVSIDGRTTITQNGDYTYTVDYENADGDDVSTGATKTVTVNVSGGGSDYPYSKTMTCTSKNYSGGTWVYTLRYSVNNSNLWNVDQSYTFHHNSGYT